jgi:hypothetical protein
LFVESRRLVDDEGGFGYLSFICLLCALRASARSSPIVKESECSRRERGGRRENHSPSKSRCNSASVL